jgi:hypothetical protein
MGQTLLFRCKLQTHFFKLVHTTKKKKREKVFACIALNNYRHHHHHNRHQHLHYGLRRESLLISVPINPKIFLVFKEYHSYRLRTKFYQISFSQDYAHTRKKLLGIISEGFDVTDQLLIRFSHSSYTG